MGWRGRGTYSIPESVSFLLQVLRMTGTMLPGLLFMLTPDEAQPGARGASRGSPVSYYCSTYGASRGRRNITCSRRYCIACASPSLLPLTVLEGAGL